VHYALKPCGVLWLGPSETIGPYQDLFDTTDPKHKIFTKRPDASPPPVHFPLGLAATRRPAPIEGLRDTPAPVDARREADRLLLGKYAPPGVLISADLEILQVWGDTGDFLAPAPGRASLNLLKMLRPGLVSSVRAAVMQARTAGHRVRQEGLRVKGKGGPRDMAVEVIPVKGASAEATWLVVFEDRTRADQADRVAPAAAPETPVAEPLDDEVARLTQELTTTREYLHAVIEQQEAAHEALQSSHEEAQSANEELQSINEELETSKEELQSSNEEVSAVNDQLNHVNLELGRVNNDLTNVLSSVQTAILILGRDLHLRRFTPAAEKLFRLIPADLGRPVQNIALGLTIEDLDACLAEVLDSLHVVEREVQDRHGRWYFLRIRPYRTLENQIDGVVLMLVDIEALRRAHGYAEGIVATVRMPLVVLDAELRVQRRVRRSTRPSWSRPRRRRAASSTSSAMPVGSARAAPAARGDLAPPRGRQRLRDVPRVRPDRPADHAAQCPPTRRPGTGRPDDSDRPGPRAAPALTFFHRQSERIRHSGVAAARHTDACDDQEGLSVDFPKPPNAMHAWESYAGAPGAGRMVTFPQPDRETLSLWKRQSQRTGREATDEHEHHRACAHSRSATRKRGALSDSFQPGPGRRVFL
jgi:hypothetical protein